MVVCYPEPQDGTQALLCSSSITVHRGLACAVSLALPRLCILGCCQAEESDRRLGKRNPQVLLHPPVCAFYCHILPSDSAIVQGDHRVSGSHWRQNTEACG